MSISEFQIQSKLGDGSYSCVYKVKRIEDGQEYALKKVKMINLSDREKENALNEVRILASIKHRNVVQYKQAFFDEPSSSLCIIMEYADNGDVFQKICEHQQGGTFLKEKIIWKILIQSVRGLKALHDLKILHRDMKSANIFLYKDYSAKLGDLNVSKIAKKGLLYTQTGTPYYASPEVWKDQPYDNKSDIWSLGCVLYEMCALVPPFRADDMNGLYKRVLKGQYPKIPSHYSMEMSSIIKSLVQVNPASRPNTEQILEMSIVSKRIKKYFKDEFPIRDLESEAELLKTIKFSKNLFKLKLPQATYEQLSFATMPTHSNKSKLRNNNQGSKTQIVEKPILPKITSSTRNNGSILNKSTNSGDGDDEYEQDFEHEDKNNQHQLKPKSRSYSGRKEMDLKNKIKKVDQQQIASDISGLPLVSNRSRQQEDIQQLPQLNNINKISPKSEIRGLQSSPSNGILQIDQSSTSITNNSTISKPRKSPLKTQNTEDRTQNTILEKIEQEDESEINNSKDKQPLAEGRKYTKVRTNITIANNSSLQQNASLLDLSPHDKSKIRENSQSMLIQDNTQVMRPKEERKNYHQASFKVDESTKGAIQLSQSPSIMSIGDVSINTLNQQPKSQNINNLQPKTNTNALTKSPNKQQSPNFKRIVNIYSVNNYKKKKYVYNNQNSNSSLLNNHVSNASNNYQIYKGDDLKVKLQQLREGMGYYDPKTKDTSDSKQNHSVLLPELKTITPSVSNVKQAYSIANNGQYTNINSSASKLINRKKSYERMINVDNQVYHLYKHQNGKIEMSSNTNIRNQNPIKIRSGAYNYGNGSILGGSGIGSELDIQGKSVINSKQILNHSYLQSNL